MLPTSILLLLVSISVFGAEANVAPTVRRLTHSQYNNTVSDLLGDQTRPADSFPQEDYVNGFKNQVSTQDITSMMAESYHGAAARLARSAFQGGNDLRGLVPCKPASPADSVCADKFIRQFGARAFRRPLTDSEAKRYSVVFTHEAKRTGKFMDGAQLVVEAILQSPKFLFRLENGGNGYDVAGRISYFLWDTMPDSELFRAAASGELSTAAGLDKAIHRMIADPRAAVALNEFTSQWMRFDLVLNTVKDRAIFPEFTPELAVAMTEETRRLVSDTVWNNRSFMEIFTANYAFVNSDLAALYRLPEPAAEFSKVQFPSGSDRAGVLGQAMFLAATSKPEETSPTIRGFSIREQFLCQIVPAPPPGVNSNLPAPSAAKPMTNKERLQAHLTNSTCAGCHQLMDTVGFGLEKFDAIGREREKQELTFTSAKPKKGEKPVKISLALDSHGTVMGLPNSNFTSPKELGGILAEAPKCQECVVKQLFRYAFGRRESDTDSALIKNAVDSFRASHFNFQELIMFMARSLAEDHRS